MRSNSERDGAAELSLGFQVTRAAASLPQSTQSPLFTVSGGRIAVLGIIGEVTTVIQTQANNCKLVANPTTGSDVDLCGVLNISGKETGTLFGITGRFSDAMVGVNAGGTVLPERPVVVAVGTIDLSCTASSTGSASWALRWLPVDEGAVATAA